MSHRPAAALLLTGLLLTSPAFADDREEANQEVVRDFYNAVVNEKDFEKAQGYLGDEYIQHNPNAVDGVEGLEGFIGFLRSNFPDSRSEIKRIFADGDHVFMHVHSKRTPDDRGRAIMELFRLENGRIVEHWDVVQDIPEEARNDNGMF